MKNVLIAAGLAGCLFAESGVQGPRLGYVSSAGGVRAVLGIVGASRLSAPLEPELRRAVVLPGSDFAAGINAEEELVRTDLRDGATISLGVKGATEIVASPNGHVVLAVAGDVAHLISRDGLALAEFVLPGAVSRVAVADQPATAAVVVAEGEGEALYLLSADGARQIFHGSRLPALAFLPSSRDLVVADDSGAIYRINSDVGLSQVGTVEGVKALAATPDGLRVLAVTGTSIYRLRFDGAQEEGMDCPCVAGVAKPLGNWTFQISPSEGGPIWIADASGGGLRIAFIPGPTDE